MLQRLPRGIRVDLSSYRERVLPLCKEERGSVKLLYRFQDEREDIRGEIEGSDKLLQMKTILVWIRSGDSFPRSGYVLFLWMHAPKVKYASLSSRLRLHVGRITHDPDTSAIQGNSCVNFG